MHIKTFYEGYYYKMLNYYETLTFKTSLQESDLTSLKNNCNKFSWKNFFNPFFHLSFISKLKGKS